ncbi:hypothetical protein A1OK_03150 [Enterovibrio norvegicus FF-454]|uniref:Uncharacterized protein n=1 Tax=Enterovibrio norvegicus FF-454 TaxID=1185651 RepID=A0A1E5C0L3_9GAMM|nr:hypothetical protein [Enterovibrio norvegicus]OEE59020.1 hypothetical protein A1OK_03150 [Enterovibrio norvegicus FF-454]
MNRQTLVLIHRTAGALAFLTVASFFTSTLFAELSGVQHHIVTVKQAILWCIPLLILSMMLTGVSGNKLYPSKGKGVIGAKQGRIKIAAANGLLVMLPSAVFLYFKAVSLEFDGYFWAVQAIELVGGAINLTMIGLNIRDGLLLKRTKNPRTKQSA